MKRDPLSAAAERWPDAPAVDVPGGERLSFRELDGLVGSGEEELARSPGSASGGVTTMRLPPSLDAIRTIHAALRTGTPLLPLHPAWTDEEVGAAVGSLTAAPGSKGLASEGPGLPSGAAFVLWTSGTSGRARGVALSLEGLEAVAEGSRRRLDLGPGDRWYWALSPAHVGGLALVLRAAWTGAAVVPLPSFDADRFLALAREGRITHASLVPVMLRRILEAAGGGSAPEPLRCLLVGGAEAPPALVRAATDAGWPVALTYGLTEASSQVATAPPARVREEPRTAGPPLPGVEVRLAEDGEIRVRGPTVALGYVGSGEPFPVDDDGWLRTGDVGEWIERKDSGAGPDRPLRELRVLGRRSRRIVTGGVNVDPAEVEAVLGSHPTVREAAVVGLPDAEWGERVAALVVAARGPEPDPDELGRFVRSRLSAAKVPRSFGFAPSLPRSPNGKVDLEAARVRLESP